MRYFLLAVCGLLLSTAQAANIPPQVVELAEQRVWKISRTVDDPLGSALQFSDDIFITACHVLEGKDPIHATRQIDTKIIFLEEVYCDKETDVAIVKRTGGDINPVDELDILFNIPPRGQEVFAIGYPFGESLTITVGHWQGASNFTHFADDSWIITTQVSGGNSGGPNVYVDAKGNLQVGGIVIGHMLNHVLRGGAGSKYGIHYYAVSTSSRSIRESLALIKYLSSSGKLK